MYCGMVVFIRDGIFDQRKERLERVRHFIILRQGRCEYLGTVADSWATAVLGLGNRVLGVGGVVQRQGGSLASVGVLLVGGDDRVIFEVGRREETARSRDGRGLLLL